MFDQPAVEPADLFGTGVSVVWVLLFGSCVTLPFLLSLWRFVVYRGRDLQAAAIERSQPPLEDGPVLLRGRVETEDRGPAVRVEIEQVGTEQSSKGGRWSHAWREQSRVVHARPFRLHVQGDEVVHVVPDERIRLVDTLETEEVAGARRVRVAELSHEEKVWVSGVLAREGQKSGPSTAYRSGPGSRVLRGTLVEPLEVASGSLRRQFSYWRRFYRKAALILGVVFLLVHGGLFGPYYALFWLGEVATVPITGTSTYTTTNKGRTTTHYVLHGRLPARAGGRAVKGEVKSRTYALAKNDLLKEAPFLYVPSATWIHAIGGEPRQSILLGLLALVACGSTLGFFLFFRSRAMPWYEQRRVVEASDGRLSDKAWYAQEPGRPGLFVARSGRRQPIARKGG